jgi:hypothetical protein
MARRNANAGAKAWRGRAKRLRYIPAIVSFSLGALIGGRLLRGPQKLQERLGALIGGRLLRGAAEAAGAADRLCRRMGHHRRGDRADLGFRARRAQSRRPRGRRHAGAGDGHPERHGASSRRAGHRHQCHDRDLYQHHCRFHAGWRHQPELATPADLGRMFMASAALGGLLLQFDTVSPLVLTSVVFSLAMIPLMFGQKPQ